VRVQARATRIATPRWVSCRRCWRRRSSRSSTGCAHTHTHSHTHPTCLVSAHPPSGPLLLLLAQVSCAAVARSWGEKLATATGQSWLAGGDALGQLSLAAGLAPAGCALLLMYGLRLGKTAISTVTVIKVGAATRTVVAVVPVSTQALASPECAITRVLRCCSCCSWSWWARGTRPRATSSSRSCRPPASTPQARPRTGGTACSGALRWPSSASLASTRCVAALAIQCRVASPAGTRRRPCSAQKQRLNKVVY
jgi:hypothetical protein